jgi:hypothetical protein
MEYNRTSENHTEHHRISWNPMNLTELCGTLQNLMKGYGTQRNLLVADK